MKYPAAILLVWAAICSAAPGQVVAPPLFKPDNRTISESKQFSVFGGSRGERSDLIRRAEDLKRSLLREWQKSDAWKAPILIVLTPGDGARLRQAPVLLQVFDADQAGRKLQLDLAPGVWRDREAVDRGLIRALLLEMALREQKFEKDRFVEPPDWLETAMTGVLQDESAGRAGLYTTLLEGKGVPDFDRFIRQNASALRGHAREIYAAQCLALYSALVQAPDGRRRVLENLTLAEPARDPWHRFSQTWPELANDPARLAREWALAMAKLATPTKLDFLPPEATATKLREILETLDEPEAGRGTAEACLALSKTEPGRFRLSRAATEAQQLALRANPLYAALVGEYVTMLDALARKKRWGFSRRFREAEALRADLDRQATEITDYMNWFQANREEALTVTSTLERWRQTANKPILRNDKISRYLDSVEERGW